MLGIIRVNAAGCKIGQMNLSRICQITQSQQTDHICSNGFLLVVFAPIDIWSTSHTSSIQHIFWFPLIQFSGDGGSIFKPRLQKAPLLALLGKKLAKLIADPTSLADYKIVDFFRLSILGARSHSESVQHVWS